MTEHVFQRGITGLAAPVAVQMPANVTFSMISAGAFDTMAL